MVGGAGRAIGFEFNFGVPEIGDPVTEFGDEALFVVGGGPATGAVGADRLEFPLAGLGVG